ncbi:cAMP-dependent protein kinase catalytic subunit [Coemansia pectinata]|uniref:cAMP-dependent protein kinase n=1 Tax=Coemansia pectinata TaxID=1052879 RepID=A0A9W8L9V2_9FUNG|nr:cAMP-dependent protein kinase catalytic subunit [Coemansia pectinata]
MFGRLNAKLAHLKATSSQRSQQQPTESSNTGLSSATTNTSAGVSEAASPVALSGFSGTASRAASPSHITSFQAARVAASAAKSLSLNVPTPPAVAECSSAVPTPVSAATTDTRTLESYHLYVETPLENAFAPLLLSPVSASAVLVSAPVVPVTQPLHTANKRRLSSPNLAETDADQGHASVADCDPHTRHAKHTRTSETGPSEVEDYYHYQHYQQQAPLPSISQYPQSSLSVPTTSTIEGHHHHHHQGWGHHDNLQTHYYQQTPAYHHHGHYLPMLSQATNQPQQQQSHMGGSAPDFAASLLRGPPGAGFGELPPLPPSDGRTLDDYQLLHTLGTGTFGRVFLCQSRLTKRYFAMKVLRKSQVVKLKQVEHINNEKNILEVARHPFIVQLECTMQNERNLYMLMEYVPGGELFSHLRRAGRFPDDVARFYAAEIVLALDYLHSLKIIWRDTKPENILLDDRGHVKLTDFGFAKRVEDRTWTLCGTPEYLAPEIIQSKGHGKAVDWWALGILIFEMLAGYPPFYDDNPFGIYEKILAGKLVFPSFFSAPARDLIQRLLIADVGKRLGNLQGDGEDIKAHAWFAVIDWQVLVQRRIPPPIVPPHRHPGDTCNFDKYPEPPQEPAPEPGVDPYRHLFSTF